MQKGKYTQFVRHLNAHWTNNKALSGPQPLIFYPACIISYPACPKSFRETHQMVVAISTTELCGQYYLPLQSNNTNNTNNVANMHYMVNYIIYTSILYHALMQHKNVHVLLERKSCSINISTFDDTISSPPPHGEWSPETRIRNIRITHQGPRNQHS